MLHDVAFLMLSRLLNRDPLRFTAYVSLSNDEVIMRLFFIRHFYHRTFYHPVGRGCAVKRAF